MTIAYPASGREKGPNMPVRSQFAQENVGNSEKMLDVLADLAVDNIWIGVSPVGEGFHMKLFAFFMGTFSGPGRDTYLFGCGRPSAL